MTIRPEGDSGPERGSGAAPALSPEQLAAIAAARRRAARVRRAAGVAAFSGWTMACFAAVTLLSGLFSLRALLLGVALAVNAAVELRGARGLRALDLRAPRLLALNQVGLALAVAIYAGWGILEATQGSGLSGASLGAQNDLADLIGPIDELARSAVVVFYALLVAGSAVAQGGAALYYASRRRHLEAYLRDTPPWVVAALRAAS